MLDWSNLQLPDTTKYVKSIVRRSKQMNSICNVRTMEHKPNLPSEEHGHVLSYVNLLRKKPLCALQYRTPNGARLSKNTIRKYLHDNGIKS